MEPVEIRLMGKKDQVTAAIQRLGSALNVSYDGNLRPKRRGDGVRAYLLADLSDQHDEPEERSR